MFPRSVHNLAHADEFHATLTESGLKKIQKARRNGDEAPHMLPGRDYKVKDEAPPGQGWIPFEHNEFTDEYRNTWVLKRRVRPVDPTFLHCPMPRQGEGEEERNASIIMTYFKPFTLNPQWHIEDVPFLGNMCGSFDSWTKSMLHWFDGRVLCEEVKRYINNFIVVTRARPEEDVDNNSDDLVSDDELVVDQDNFADAVATRIGTGRDMPDSRCAGHVDASEDPLGLKVAPN